MAHSWPYPARPLTLPSHSLSPPAPLQDRKRPARTIAIDAPRMQITKPDRGPNDLVPVSRVRCREGKPSTQHTSDIAPVFAQILHSTADNLVQSMRATVFVIRCLVPTLDILVYTFAFERPEASFCLGGSEVSRSGAPKGMKKKMWGHEATVRQAPRQAPRQARQTCVSRNVRHLLPFAALLWSEGLPRVARENMSRFSALGCLCLFLVD